MPSVIDSLGKAARHNFLIRAECACGNVRHYRAADLMMELGGGRDPRSLRFRCTSCKPLPFTITLFQPDLTRLPKVMVWKPFKVNGMTEWMPERLK